MFIMPRSIRYAPASSGNGNGELTQLLLTVLLIVMLLLLIIQFIRPSFFSAVGHPVPSTVATALSPSMPPIQIINRGGDSRYDRAPQPLRDWMSAPEFPPRGGIASLPINIPTKGLPESFQSVGIVSVDDKILPLYGRRTAGSSDRWNYYTRTDTYNPVPLPVRFQRRDCMDDTGCQELMSGETVKIDGMHKEGKTELYRMDGPKYIPGLM